MSAQSDPESGPISPTELSQFIVAYTDKWGKVIRAAGIKAD